MKKHMKGNIRSLIDLEEEDGLGKSIIRLTRRYNYLASKMKLAAKIKKAAPSAQMKYINFHLKKLKKMEEAAA